MNQSSCRPDLLKVVLGLREDCTVHATDGFQSWMRRCEPRAKERGDGLLLLDTRNRNGRTYDHLMGRIQSGQGWTAALILAATPIWRAPHRLFRWFGSRDDRRLSATRVERTLDNASSNFPFHVQRLGYARKPVVPARFQVIDSPNTFGTALLLTKQRPFTGGVWAAIKEGLGADSIQVREVQLRWRGVAVVFVRLQDSEFVVRITPERMGDSPASSHYNNLLVLHDLIAGNAYLREVLPQPTLATEHGTSRAFVETRLSGEMAWRQAKGHLGQAIYQEALEFLETFKVATYREPLRSTNGLNPLLDPDEKRLEQADFVRDDTRHLMKQHYDLARSTLARIDLETYASHGDFGYGNILVESVSGRLTGVIDWETARFRDLPGIDRVNLEIQMQKAKGAGFDEAVKWVWRNQRAHEALDGLGGGPRVRSLFNLAVCRYIIRSLSHPREYQNESGSYQVALRWLLDTHLG